MAGIFIITGPTALILEASSNGNFTTAQTVLWLFAVYVFGGLFGLILPLYYRIPIVGGNTLTGVAFLATKTSQFTFNELIGAYIVSGVFMLLIGFLLLIFGLFSWKLVPLIQALPKEFISIIVGFSLLGVFGNNLHQSFSKQSIKISVAFAFIIALSNITILSVSAPVWSLVVGAFIARYIENNKREKMEKKGKKTA